MSGVILLVALVVVASYAVVVTLETKSILIIT